MADYINDDGQTVCGKCGHIFMGGEWPFCPHPQREGSPMIERDEIPGGITLENYGPHPVTVYSHSERRRLMVAQGLQEKETFCPLPGTDKDPQGIPNPKGYVDKQTLANATELICRNGQAEREWDPVEAGVLTNQKSGPITRRDGEAIASGDARRQSRLFRRMH